MIKRGWSALLLVLPALVISNAVMASNCNDFLKQNEGSFTKSAQSGNAKNISATLDRCAANQEDSSQVDPRYRHLIPYYSAIATFYAQKSIQKPGSNASSWPSSDTGNHSSNSQPPVPPQNNPQNTPNNSTQAQEFASPTSAPTNKQDSNIYNNIDF